jgi:hypothetical protein
MNEERNFNNFIQHRSLTRMTKDYNKLTLEAAKGAQHLGYYSIYRYIQESIVSGLRMSRTYKTSLVSLE